MAQTRGTAAEFYNDLDREVHGSLGKEFKALSKIWPQVYDIKTSKKQQELVTGIVGMGDAQEKPEGQPFATDIIQAGYSKQFLHLAFGLAFEVTMEAQEDDRYDVISEYSKWLMFAMNVVYEKRAALLFNNGFTTELSPDGVSIFNSAHPLKGSGSTARNQLSVASNLSWTSLAQALIDWQRETKFESGQFMQPADNLILYVPPELEFTADRIVKSVGLPGTADNDPNSIKSLRNIKVIKNVYLTDPNAWFLLTQNKTHGFRSYTRLGISMLPGMTNIETRNRHYPVRGRQSWGNIRWQGSFGTAGA
jgi:hypothetical protein